MTVIVAISEGGGMLFNGRRQSRDRNLTEDVVNFVGQDSLYITKFSEKLFSDYGNVKVTDDPLSLPENAVFFAENFKISNVSKKITKMVIYKWNKKYPSDFYLDTSPSSLGLKLSSSVDFTGYSHDKITREVYG